MKKKPRKTEFTSPRHMDGSGYRESGINNKVATLALNMEGWPHPKKPRVNQDKRTLRIRQPHKGGEPRLTTKVAN